MKRVFVILISALILLGAGVLVVSALSNWIADNFIHSDDDMNTVGKIIFLGIYPGLLVIGGWLGNVVYQRNLTRRSSGRS
jgi:hypothetical protein